MSTDGRVKFRVWSPAQGRWRTAYCRPELVHVNAVLMGRYGLRVQIGPQPRHG